MKRKVAALLGSAGVMLGALAPAVVLAAEREVKLTAVDEFIGGIVRVIVNPLLLLMFAAALVVFLWGILQLLANLDSEEARLAGKQHLLWGLIGMFIMFAVFAIIGVITGTFGIRLP